MRRHNRLSKRRVDRTSPPRRLDVRDGLQRVGDHSQVDLLGERKRIEDVGGSEHIKCFVPWEDNVSEMVGEGGSDSCWMLDGVS